MPLPGDPFVVKKDQLVFATMKLKALWISKNTGESILSESPKLPKLTQSRNFNSEIRTLEYSTAITVQAVHSFFVNVHMRTIRFGVDNGTKKQQTKRAHNNGTRAATPF